MNKLFMSLIASYSFVLPLYYFLLAGWSPIDPIQSLLVYSMPVVLGIPCVNMERIKSNWQAGAGFVVLGLVYELATIALVIGVIGPAHGKFTRIKAYLAVAAVMLVYLQVQVLVSKLKSRVEQG